MMMTTREYFHAAEEFLRGVLSMQRRASRAKGKVSGSYLNVKGNA